MSSEIGQPARKPDPFSAEAETRFPTAERRLGKRFTPPVKGVLADLSKGHAARQYADLLTMPGEWRMKPPIAHE